MQWTKLFCEINIYETVMIPVAVENWEHLEWKSEQNQAFESKNVADISLTPWSQIYDR
jgi:hypothetical protein